MLECFSLVCPANLVIIIIIIIIAWKRDLLGIVVQPLGLHPANVGSIPTGPKHGEVRLQPHPGDVLKSSPNVRKSPRSGGKRGSAPIDAERRRWPCQGRSEDWGGSSYSENSVINVFFYIDMISTLLLRLILII